MFISCNETKQNGLEDDMIQWKRYWCRNVTNVGEKSRQEGLCSYQMGGEAFRHRRSRARREANGAGGSFQEEVFGCVWLQDGDLSDYARILCSFVALA